MATGRANAPAVLADRGRIIGLWQGGMAPADVADAMGVSKKTVQRWITRWQEEGSLTTRPRSCRPRVTTQDENARLLAAVDNTLNKIVIDFTRELMLPCHPQTSRNRLHKSGINCYVPAKKQNKLTQAHREARLGFTLEYLGVDPMLWPNVIFTDVKSFSSVKAGARFCWRPVNTRCKDKNIDERATSGRVTVNMWGSMWAYDPGENLWAIITRNWDVGEERSREIEARHANEVWERLRRRPNICFNLVESMPERI
ncbi:uncharacterized protein LOC121863129, partial [Homarus americanus]|uniref:uncharacterized protein LOC121863129 n=1 Tax=Homarus americanus TaxID=6706 RepID=UPI001C4377CF